GQKASLQIQEQETLTQKWHNPTSTTHLGPRSTGCLVVNRTVLVLIPALQEIQQNYPNSDVFISGDLAVDFPEDIQIPLKKNHYATASLNGTTLKLSYCPLDKAIALLREQYAVGTVEVRIMRSQT
nr:hypothetical protein [Pleurocapsa sp. MO_226.B13]